MLRAAALVIAALATAGCGGQAKPRSAQAATLHVRQELIGRGMYTEGSYSYVRVERDGDKVVQVRLSDERTPRATVRLDPGSYRLVSFQRPCDGNCGILDPPMDQCTKTVEVEADADIAVLVSLSPGQGCEIEEGTRVD
jgi:hypothetical protein